MNAKKGYYTLIQFCPDASRLEAVNMGVLLFCPEADFVAARLDKSNRRAAKLVGRTGLNPAALNSAKRALERRLKIDAAAFRTLEDLQHFVNSRGNILQLTPLRPLKVFDPHTELDKLFFELVGGQPRPFVGKGCAPAPLDMVTTELNALFQRLAQEHRARLDWTIEVPLVGRRLHIPFAFRNGAWNLVKPWRFSGHEKPALTAAMHLAVEGDLIRRHGTDAEGEKKLIVVSLFDEPARAEKLEGRVAKVLQEYNVEIFAGHEVSNFASDVEKLAHHLFVFKFPVYLVVDEKLHNDSGFPHSIKLVEEEWAGMCLPVFTDQDLAERFIESQGSTGLTCVPLERAKAFDDVLAFAEQGAIVHVAFDPGQGKAGFVLVKDVRKQVQAGAPLGELDHQSYTLSLAHVGQGETSHGC